MGMLQKKSIKKDESIQAASQALHLPAMAFASSSPPTSSMLRRRGRSGGTRWQRKQASDKSSENQLVASRVGPPKRISTCAHFVRDVSLRSKCLEKMLKGSSHFESVELRVGGSTCGKASKSGPLPRPATRLRLWGVVHPRIFRPAKVSNPWLVVKPSCQTSETKAPCKAFASLSDIRETWQVKSINENHLETIIIKPITAKSSQDHPKLPTQQHRKSTSCTAKNEKPSRAPRQSTENPRSKRTKPLKHPRTRCFAGCLGMNRAPSVYGATGEVLESQRSPADPPAIKASSREPSQQPSSGSSVPTRPATSQRQSGSVLGVAGWVRCELLSL